MFLLTIPSLTQVNGLDEQGFDFQRITHTAISSIEPAIPVVYMKKLTLGYYDKTAVLTCTVESVAPFSVQWYNGGEPLGNELFFR